MGNVSGSVSGLGAADASRKSARGSQRTCQQRRRPASTSSCCHLAHTTSQLVLGGGSKFTRRTPDLGQVTGGSEAGRVAALEQLLARRRSVELDESSVHCASPFSDATSCSSGSSGYLDQLATSLGEERDDDDDDDDDKGVVVMCDEDRGR